MVMGKKSKTATLGAEACLLRPYFGLGFSVRLFRAVQRYVGQFDVRVLYRWGIRIQGNWTTPPPSLPPACACF